MLKLPTGMINMRRARWTENEMFSFQNLQEIQRYQNGFPASKMFSKSDFRAEIKIWGMAVIPLVSVPGGEVVKNMLANAGDARDVGFNSWVGKIP